MRVDHMMFLARCSVNMGSTASSLVILPVSLTAASSLLVLASTCLLADDSGRRPISAEVFSRAK